MGDVVVEEEEGDDDDDEDWGWLLLPESDDTASCQSFSLVRVGGKIPNS